MLKTSRSRVVTIFGDVDIVNGIGGAGLRFDRTRAATALTLTAAAITVDANPHAAVNFDDPLQQAQNYNCS
jgi:hypothetical protein